MQWANRAFAKIHLYRHHFARMGQNAPGNAIAQIVELGLLVESKHESVL